MAFENLKKAHDFAKFNFLIIVFLGYIASWDIIKKKLKIVKFKKKKKKAGTSLSSKLEKENGGEERALRGVCVGKI
jgi:hypothetical protein